MWPHRLSERNEVNIVSFWDQICKIFCVFPSLKSSFE